MIISAAFTSGHQYGMGKFSPWVFHRKNQGWQLLEPERLLGLIMYAGEILRSLRDGREDLQDTNRLNQRVVPTFTRPLLILNKRMTLLTDHTFGII
jgi:hypothetical protein